MFLTKASRKRSLVHRAGVAVVLFSAFCSLSAFSRDKEKEKANYDGVGTFSIELDQPYAKVLDVVRDAATSGIIHGTYEYKDEDSLPKADAQKSSKLFPSWEGEGEVLFKVRTKAISPAHFVNSVDVGTVAVRYVVQQLTPTSTRLYIDAVYVTDSHHGKHPSDGYVETTEYNLISQRLTEIDQMHEEAVAALTRRNAPTAVLESSSKDRQDGGSPPPSGGNGADDVRRQIADERARIDAANRDIRQLQEQVQQLRAASTVKVANNGAELRRQPYIHAASLQVVKKGEELTVLAKTPFWYRVRSTEGAEGWIYRGYLEAHE